MIGKLSIVFLTVTIGAQLALSAFPGTKFRFGAWFKDSNTDYSHVDHIAIWIGDESTDFGNNFNVWWHGAAIKAALKYNKTPVYYGYLIAFWARTAWGLQDCDVSGTNNLCTRGADFIRARRADIVAKYKKFATDTAAVLGSTKEMVWLIEPDFWQYYGDSKQQNGPLSGAYMRSLFDDIAVAIKSQLPNALISWDISPWLTQAAMRTWWGFFSTSTNINFLHTSGGDPKSGTSASTAANSAYIRPTEPLTWAFMATLTGKKIIADTGYNAFGGSTGSHDSAWDSVTNINNRIRDGVVAVTQAAPKSTWASTLTTIRPQLLGV